MKSKTTKRRTASKTQKTSTAPKRLLQLNIAFDEHKWLTWENVGQIGKNNIRHLIKVLREEIRALTKQHSKMQRGFGSRVLPHSKASKELGALKQLMDITIQHRKEVIIMLTAIAKMVPNKPQLPGFGEIKNPIGTILFQNQFDGTWIIAAYEHTCDDRNYLEVPFVLVQELRACRDRDYLRIAKKVFARKIGRGALDDLLAMPLPTEHEMVTKRLNLLRNIQEMQKKPSDELLSLIAQDETWLENHAPQEVLDKQEDTTLVDEIESMKKS